MHWFLNATNAEIPKVANWILVSSFIPLKIIEYSGDKLFKYTTTQLKNHVIAQLHQKQLFQNYWTKLL